MRSGRAVVLVVAALVLGVLAAGPAHAKETYYSGKALQGTWYTPGNYETTTSNTSVGSAGIANAHAKVGTFVVSSTTSGVVQTYSRRHARVACRWTNSNFAGDRIPWTCYWKNT